MDAAVPPRFKPTEPDRRWQGEHEWLDRRSLAMHRWMAEILRDHPGWLHERVRPTLLRWMQQVDPRNRPYLQAWLDVLDQGLEVTIDLMTRDDERARAMRQSSPFVNILTPQQRWAFLREWERNHEKTRS